MKTNQQPIPPQTNLDGILCCFISKQQQQQQHLYAGVPGGVFLLPVSRPEAERSLTAREASQLPPPASARGRARGSWRPNSSCPSAATGTTKRSGPRAGGSFGPARVGWASGASNAEVSSGPSEIGAPHEKQRLCLPTRVMPEKERFTARKGEIVMKKKKRPRSIDGRQKSSANLTP